MTRNYWERTTGGRLSRRKALIASGGASAALLFAACGGGSDDSTSSTTGSEGKSKLLTLPKDTSSQAKAGGTLRTVSTADPPNFDPLLGGSSIVVSAAANYTYPRLLKYATSKFPKPASGDAEGDLAESYELSADKLQITFKLRQGLKWDQKAPTSGRVIDASDVVFSWNKFARVSALRGDIAYSAQTPFAPVESVSSPDSRTVVFKLHQPDASIVGLFTSPRHLAIMPKESDGGFDPKVEMRGYGPWLLDEFRPSALMSWKKNPNYYIKGRPFPDRVEVPVVTEYAAQMAQFRAGNIYTNVAQQNDILQTKQDVPDVELRQDTGWVLSHNGFKFGYEGNSPFKDLRMRQAANMLVDNDAFGEVFAESAKFKNAGLDVEIRYNTIVAPGFEGFWVDPRDKKAFGANSKYMKYDVAEAKKLMTAAGFANGVDTSFWYSSTRLPPSYTKASQILSQMLTDGGIRAKLAPIDNYDDFINNYLYAYTNGNQRGFNGIWYVMENLSPTCVSYLFAVCHKDGGRFQGMSPDGTRAWQGDSTANSMIEKMKLEFDNKKLQDQVHEFTKYFHGQGYRKVNAWASLPFSLVWPALANWGVDQTFTGGNLPAEANINVWIDDSKPPLKKA